MSLYSRIINRINRWAVQNSAYEAGGTSGRRTKGWLPGASGPRSTVNNSLVNLRNRSRDQIRNNGTMAHGITSLVSSEVGTGIVPRSRAADEELREEINKLWNRSAAEFDADGVLDVYGMQSLASRTRRAAGEVFLRRRRRSARDGLAVPLQIQMLEPEFVPVGLNKSLPNGNEICAGIEFNKRGQRVAYHMYRQHPGDGYQGFANDNLLRIPARDVIHHYMRLRPGQIRGEPDAVASLLSARDLHDYQDAELVRKKARAPFTGFMKRAAVDHSEEVDPLTGLPKDVENDLPELTIQPGMFLTGIPGEELQLFDGDNAGDGYADYIRVALQAQAAGLNLPYEMLTGDWSKVNDRLVRVVLNEFRRCIESVQDHYMVHQVCGGIWRWWLDAAVMARAVAAPGYGTQRHEVLMCEWRPQGWQYIHPVQDVEAKLMAIAGGLTSRQAEVAKSGWDVEEIDQQNREDQQRAADLGYSYNSAGGGQQANDPAVEEPSQPAMEEDDDA